jgi:hypothetical protein
MREFPQELIDKTIDQLVSEETAGDSNVDLRTCSLVAKRWTSQAQKKGFESVISQTLGTSKKLLALVSASPHIGAYIKFLHLRVDSFDVGNRTGELATLAAIIGYLCRLEALDLSVVAHREPFNHSHSLHAHIASRGHMVHSYLFPPALICSLQNGICK